MTDLVELRGDVDESVISVIDAVVQATPGANRMTVVRQILKEWAEREIHRSTLVLRVTRSHGTETESGGKR